MSIYNYQRQAQPFTEKPAHASQTDEISKAQVKHRSGYIAAPACYQAIDNAENGSRSCLPRGYLAPLQRRAPLQIAIADDLDNTASAPGSNARNPRRRSTKSRFTVIRRTAGLSIYIYIHALRYSAALLITVLRSPLSSLSVLLLSFFFCFFSICPRREREIERIDIGPRFCTWPRERDLRCCLAVVRASRLSIQLSPFHTRAFMQTDVRG